MNNIYPKIKKDIEDFAFDEEGSIPRSKILAIGSMVVILSMLLSEEVHATHYSHSSHRSHYSHYSSTHRSHSNSHSSHSSLPQPDIPKVPNVVDDFSLSNIPNVNPSSLGSVGVTPEFKSKIKL